MGRIMMNGIQYGTGGRPTAEGVTYDNAESGMTATNVQGALDELSTGLTTIYEGAWTATSSATTNTQLTEKITLPKGIYLLFASLPNATGSVISTGLTNTLGLTIPLYISTANGTACRPIRVESENSFWFQSTTVQTMTFSYLERGYIQALKVGEITS